MKVFKIPKQKPTAPSKIRPNKIVGIIDASGSMDEAWPLVAEHWNKYVSPDNAYTITFDHNPHFCKSNILNTSLKYHGGGKTSLVKVFQKFETKLEMLAADSNLTVIFISDGQDNISENLDKEMKILEGAKTGMCINFLCLGIGAGFPTFLAMNLRDKYHTGDATIPAVFLIEYISAKAFFNKFESMKQYFTYSDKMLVMPPVIQYPWEEPKGAVHENSWVLTDSSVLEVEGEVYNLGEKIDVEGVLGIYKGWLQRIHLEALKPVHRDIELMALDTLKMMRVLAEEVKKVIGYDILTGNQNTEEEKEAEILTFHQRVMRNFIKNSLSRAAWYYEEVRLLSKGKALKQFDEYEAAKRIGIGTIVGKYHQKALALKGLTVPEFRKLRDVFADVYKETKLTNDSSQEGSVVTLQNQKEVFLEPNFLDGLLLCQNQFDLVESFPVIGLAIRIKRFSGSMVNPWLTLVTFIARHHKIVDSISVVKSQNNLQLKVGKDEIEAVNAVLPLFTEEDQDMKPLLRSKLYHLLMNFNVSQNVDTLYEDAYLALLSNTLIYLLTQQDSDWKKDLLEKIYSTVKLVYYDDPSFIKYREGLLKDPVLTISEDEEQKRYGNMDLSKAALHIFTLAKDGEVSKEQIQAIMNVIIAWFFYYTVKDPKFKIELHCKSKLVSELRDEVLNRVRNQFKNFYTMKELQNGIYQEIDAAIAKEGKFEYFWDLKSFYKTDSKVHLEIIEKLSNLVTGKPPTKEEFINWLARTYTGETFIQVFSSHLTVSLEDLTRHIGKQLAIDNQKGGLKRLGLCQPYIKVLSKEFSEWFKSIHEEVLPITAKDIREHTYEPIEKFKFNKDNGLLYNACAARKCPHFLDVHKSIGRHLALWQDSVPPAFHATVRKFNKLSGEEIYEKFMKGKGMVKDGETFVYEEEKYRKNKNEIMKYIAEVKRQYRKVESEGSF